MLDDRTEVPKSFTVGRILIDSYQWEIINEWVSIKIENQTFEVHVKEVGAEIYSIHAHPNCDPRDSDSTSMELDVADRRITVASAEAQQSQTSLHREPSHIINADVRIVGGLNLDYEPLEQTKIHFPAWCAQLGYDWCSGLETGPSNPGLDPMIIEAQIVTNWGCCQQILNNEVLDGLRSVNDGPNGIGDTLSSSSCPYPPGFGPCSVGAHQHDNARARRLCEIVCETPTVAGERDCVSIDSERVVGNLSVPPHEANNQSGVRWGFNETVLAEVGSLKRRVGERCFLPNDCAVESAGVEKTSTDSDETLYLINKDVGYEDWLEEEIAR
ncbi:hypothetical protein PIB30_025824 [Stylosanthes scabra]|uniref:Uncharacterized protein n=1 Tax=Stylosanthes scabra TaxID=79078 RepID=A0ABU6U925_9FABA|nr:hypothetical protein [Stylosanthes scabra]